MRAIERPLLVAATAWGCLAATPAAAQQDDAGPASLLEALSGGKIDFDLRARFEYVDQDGLASAQAWTERIRLGYGTLPYHGFSFYIGFEDLRSPDYDRYNAAGLNGQPGRAVVADPRDTDLDQLYSKYDWRDRDTEFVLGRQRIILDDERFVGNVGWRQLQQTFDALTIKSSVLDEVTLFYGYLWEINRVFGPNSGLDFESDSHLINVSYEGLDFAKVTGFAYLLDFANSAANSSNTLGIRFAGEHDLSQEISLGFILSYAHQSDGDENPTDYDADYFLAELSLSRKQWGTLGAGYELLGSDNGVAAFRTPLATGHKFSGWADVFLTTPAAGLQDIYVYAKGTLPWEVQGRIVYHFFDADEGGGDYGGELDILLSRKLTPNWTVTAKYADFNGQSGFADRSKIWLQTTYSF